MTGPHAYYIYLCSSSGSCQESAKQSNLPSASPNSYLLPNIVVVDVCVAAVAVVAVDVVAVTHNHLPLALVNIHC